MQMLNLSPSHARIHEQSKECQKIHWKASHKVVCPQNVAVIQCLAKSPEGKGWSKNVKRWVTAWTPSIVYCLALALDLANHEWGRHDTHVYAPTTLYFMFVFPDLTLTRSLVIFMEPTGLGEGYQSFRVGKLRAYSNPSA